MSTSTAELRKLAQAAKIPGYWGMGKKKLAEKLAKVTAIPMAKVTAVPMAKVTAIPMAKVTAASGFIPYKDDGDWAGMKLPHSQPQAPLPPRRMNGTWSVRRTPLTAAELPARFVFQAGEMWVDFANDTESYEWGKAAYGQVEWKPLFYTALNGGPAEGPVVGGVIEGGDFDPRTGIYSRYEGSEHVFRVLVRTTCQIKVVAPGFERVFTGLVPDKDTSATYKTLVLTGDNDGCLADWVFDDVTVSREGDNTTFTAAGAPKQKLISDIVDFMYPEAKTMKELAQHYDGKIITHDQAPIFEYVRGSNAPLAHERFSFITAY